MHNSSFNSQNWMYYPYYSNQSPYQVVDINYNEISYHNGPLSLMPQFSLWENNQIYFSQ